MAVIVAGFRGVVAIHWNEYSGAAEWVVALDKKPRDLRAVDYYRGVSAVIRQGGDDGQGLVIRSRELCIQLAIAKHLGTCCSGVDTHTDVCDAR